MSLRVFAGFHFSPEDVGEELVAIGYEKGDPMGADITGARQGQRPGLLIQAFKDPVGANLDRVQVVKGWLDEEGNRHEKVYDVLWSGDRQPDAEGKVGPVGNTVNLETAVYTNTIGAGQLSGFWEDPDFDPSQRAFYYVRVLEIPTPRHNLYDAVALQMDPAETGKPATIQERAWPSPIWYTPGR